LAKALGDDLRNKGKNSANDNKKEVKKDKSFIDMSKMLGIGQLIITTLMDTIDTIFCLKHKLKKMQSDQNPQVLEAFNALNNCIRLSFFCFSLFLFLNIFTYINNSKYMDFIMSDCKYGIMCLGFISFMREPTSIIFLFVLCLLIYITIVFVYILYQVIKFFINTTEIDFIGDTYFYSKLLFTSPSIRIKSPEDAANFKDFFFTTMFKKRESLKK
jgi:hypothetical protein